MLHHDPYKIDTQKIQLQLGRLKQLNPIYFFFIVSSFNGSNLLLNYYFLLQKTDFQSAYFNRSLSTYEKNLLFTVYNQSQKQLLHIPLLQLILCFSPILSARSSPIILSFQLMYSNSPVLYLQKIFFPKWLLLHLF